MTARVTARVTARGAGAGASRARRPLLAAAGLALAAGAVHAAPSATARGAWRARLLPDLVGVGAPGGVALTFDDGPDPRGTPAVLAALDDLGWSATFFLLGSQVARHGALAREVVAAGHEVAVHGDAHRNHLGRTAADLVGDLARARDLVEDAAGASPRWFRPPYGVLSAGSLVAARAARLRPVLWTAWGRDWLAPAPDVVAATVLGQLRERGTVLLHDSDCTSVPGSWRATAASLPVLAEGLAARGWAARSLRDHLTDHLTDHPGAPVAAGAAS